jgi:hypothetical protein
VFFPAIIAATVSAQTTTNPDISFIGDVRAVARHNSPDGLNNPQISFDEMEMAASGYLNPYSRADAVVSFSNSGEVDIEEAYATVLRGLPWNLQVRTGKYLVDFGKLNTQHAHQWSWIERPLMFQRFFGEEGLKDVGVNVTTLIPVGASALGVSANVLEGAFFLPEDSEDTPPLASSGRLSLFVPVAEHSEIEFGVSALHGQDDFVNKRWATMGDFDFKYKWKPSMYNSLVIVAEALTSSKTIASDTLTPDMTEKVSTFGTFIAFDYQFHRRFDVGSFYDYSQSPVDKDDHQTAYGVFAGFGIAEETYRLGLLLRHDDATELEKGYETIQLQLLWALGPHKPHIF